MHNSRLKFRKIKNFFNKSLNIIKFKIEAFSFAKIVILVWVIIWIISLFMSHINPLFPNIFNKITITSSSIFIISFFIILFLLFSYNKKEKIKKSSNILFRDYIIIIYLSIIIFILTINNLWIILWLETFKSEISYWNWIIMILLSSIFLFIWWVLLKNEYSSWKNIYLNDSPEEKLEEMEKNNTKLPF